MGSRNDNSSLAAYLNKLMNKINTLDSNVEIDYYNASNTTIYHSTGCKNCFTKGYCNQDQLDDDQMGEIKDKMLKADFIIMASPVYSHNVSGDTKAFIDRLSYWGHLFRLAGKHGMVFASGGNGLNHVLDYQEKVLTYMGVIIKDRVSVISGQEITDTELTEIAESILAHARGEMKLESNDGLESAFLTFRWIYSAYEKDHVEYLYWEKNGLFECGSFQEVLDMVGNKKLVDILSTQV